MTATTTQPPPPARPAPPARSSGARTAAIAVASVMAALSLAAFALGGVALWGDAQRNDEGYISSATHRFTASTAALTSEEIDVNADIPGWAGGDDAYGKMRMHVESRDGDPIFAGVARTADVERYLAGAPHTEVTDIDTDPFDATYEAHEGARTPAAPDAQDIWVATTEGAGTRTLDWDVHDGSWSVVVMNADASRGVDADVSAGVKVSFLGPLGWSLLGGGVLLLLGAAGVGYAGLRRR